MSLRSATRSLRPFLPCLGLALLGCAPAELDLPSREPDASEAPEPPETEPVVKGQTAAKSFKPAVLDNGVRIMIPPFIGVDEAVIVNTETMEYSERA